MDKIGFWKIFIVVILAELPCLLRTMCIQMHNESIWNVIWGTIAGSMVALFVGIILAKFVQVYASHSTVEVLERISAFTLIILGVYLLWKGCIHEHL